MTIKPRGLFIAGLFLGLFFCTGSFAQAPARTYDKEWKKVEDLLKKELPKSALEQVKIIYAQAKKDHQDGQVIKALVYMVGLREAFTEHNDALAIADLENESRLANEPAKSILNNIIAQLYWQYYRQHRWQLYDRTNTQDFKKDDIATWTATDFHKKIGDLYLLSLKNVTLLQQTRLEAYDAIITKGNMRQLRPTLFDLLAHSALDYFKNDERDITKPAYSFEIDQPSAFSPASDFVHQRFVTNDSLSLAHKALLLYQQLITFHLPDTKPAALLDVDIERIEFVNEKTVLDNKKQLYLDALNSIANRYPNQPDAAQASYLIAKQYSDDADTYQPYGDTTHRYSKVRAKEICEKILTQKDSSEGKINCYNLLNEINRKNLQFSVEKVTIPGQPFRALIQYKNVDRVYLRLIKRDEKWGAEASNYFDDKIWNRIVAVPAVKSWEQSLPATNDLQQHSAEIKVDPLPAGTYFMLVSSDKTPDAKNSILGLTIFYVSQISYVNSGANYFVLDRQSGKPLANAAVQLWEQKYDYKTSETKKEKGDHFKTDEKGFFKLEETGPAATNHNFSLDISYNGDRLFMDDLQNSYYYNYDDQNIQKHNSVFLFTDRSIYRPGQTLYFKGIAISNDAQERKNAIVSNYKTRIYLRNVNYEMVDSMNVVTNDYGSFSGKFQLPQSGLNGEFTLVMKNEEGQSGFSVEEYKRPKFYVGYEKLKGTYRVNDTIRIAGFAKAYAGNNIDGAKVEYRVVREPRFIYDWLFWKWWHPPVKEMEIAHGEITTGKDGGFQISFAAIPDLSLDKKFEPVFDYKIYADVTDINGETRSAESIVTVGYKSLLLHIDLPEKLDVDSLKNISVSTTNMAGEFEPALLSVTVSKLKEDQRLVRNRYWQRPDMFTMTKEEYIRLFPNDEFDNETDPKGWEKEKQVYRATDSSNKNSVLKIQNTGISPGYYLLEVVTKDKDGNEVKEIKYVELYDTRSNKLTHPEYLWTEASEQIEPGQKTNIKIGSTADDVYLVQQLNKNVTTDNAFSNTSFSVQKLANEKKAFEFSASEADRGGYGVIHFFVKDNRFYQYSDVIQVPWSNKDLKIEYATFRDKTLPGSGEKWKVKITGLKNEKIAAEMLAGMYDASLDQFKPGDWQRPSIWPYYSNYSSWNSIVNFSEKTSDQRQYQEIPFMYVEKRYDLLFGNRLRGGDEEIRSARPMANESVSDMQLKGVSPKAKGEEFEDAKVISADTSRLNIKKPEAQDNTPIQVRKNFNETAFFFPDLHTDSAGAIEFSFTMPEALTKWKLQTLAHTRDLAFGFSTKEVITQKQLMVQPNAPRFLREGDRMEFSAKIVNLSDSEFTGQAQLQLFDATTNQSVDGWFQNMMPNQFFTVAAGGSEAIKFPIQVPYLFNKALTWRIVARASISKQGVRQPDISDGEEDAMPVLTNKTLVTETLPLNMRTSGTREFKFDKLLNAGESESLQHYALTVEYTGNPAWYAVQALPYLTDYPYECAEQTWNRYYSNSLASAIANSSPRIEQIVERWNTKDTAALLSNLQKNQELKSVLLEETPWVLEAKTEEQQKKNIALLFDMARMGNELNNSLEKLKQMQSENGGFVWFTGGPDDRYITQYIITGIGHLKKLKAITSGQEEKLNQVLEMALPYLDMKIKQDYDYLIKRKANLKTYAPDYSAIQYLYMRSFFTSYPVAKGAQTAYTYFRKQAQLNWTKETRYMQGMVALALSRTGDVKTPAAILKSLSEKAINSEELGMYWKNENVGWFWYQAPIETQSLMVEAFQEITKNTKTVDDLKVWLLKNKQTNNWKTTKATAEACYALLLPGTQWLSSEPSIEIKLGGTVVSNNANQDESGTGYFKKTIEGEKIIPSMGAISVSVNNANQQSTASKLSWGAVYWQYFQDLDKITAAASPLSIAKTLFVEKNTDRGPVLTPVKEGDELHVGNKIKVRIEIRVDRDMEYVHMKDMRASDLEPVNVLSEYKWQGGLGYYESTKDASTNFFFNYLPKGTYVFEYPLFITHAGNFSNGITTIQCMYAPEFGAHSEGIRINVEE